MTYELGEVIATRELYVIDDHGTRRTITIELGKPTRFPDSTDYYVPFKITGMGSNRVLCAAGIDAFQALQQVMPIISAKLSVLNEAADGRLRWEGDESGGLGFPGT
jgi:hypothetical protein